MGDASNDLLTQGREAFRRRAWGEAFECLQSVDDAEPLSAEDLDRLGMAAHLVGRDRDGTEAWTRAHASFVQDGHVEAAARCAFWLALQAVIIDGNPARSSGWQTRVQRLLDDAALDGVERGYLVLLNAIRLLYGGELPDALTEFQAVTDFGTRFRDGDLLALGRLGQGQVMARTGHRVEGMKLFDEVLVSVTADEASSIIAGIVYCAVIEECQFAFDFPRAQLWTEALNRWCSSQPGLVPYRRQCLAHRAEILRFRGAWDEAMAEAARACDLESQVPDHHSTGEALYQLAEICRLRGDYSGAEEAYRDANRMGRSPNPGLALLRLAQGRQEAAASALLRELDEPSEARARAGLLAANVEVQLAMGDLTAARSASEALSGIAREIDAPLLNAMALQAEGAIAVVEKASSEALVPLRRAWKAWFDLEAPYEAAAVRVLIGLCCRELADHESAELEFDAAMQIFMQLGAAPDLKRLQALASPPGTKPGGLTDRECDVLRLIVEGKTNPAIARELFISDHTVRRHVQNIFAKLGVSSRAAAAAFAFQHDLF